MANFNAKDGAFVITHELDYQGNCQILVSGKRVEPVSNGCYKITIPVQELIRFSVDYIRMEKIGRAVEKLENATDEDILFT